MQENRMLLKRIFNGYYAVSLDFFLKDDPSMTKGKQYLGFIHELSIKSKK